MRLLPALFELDHPLWRAAHRPLFLCAALAALLAPAVWLWPGDFGVDPVFWHLHALLFGMGGAAVGGYLLTALPSWTGAGPVLPPSVRVLTLLWIVARLAMLWSGILPFGVLVPLALGYVVALALVLARALVAARAWSRLWSVAAVAGLMLGDALVLAQARGIVAAPEVPLGMVLLFATLVGLIGGRAVPAFTISWLQHQGAPLRVRDSRGLAALAVGATALGGGLVLGGAAAAAGPCLLLAGTLHGARMAGWHSARAWHYPALFMLHLAWAWLPVGLILLGLALLDPQGLPPAAGLHALTMGAMGSMILAIAGRAAMRRHGRRLIAGRGMVLAFALVWLAALPRVAAPIVPAGWPDPVIASAVLWMLGWVVFLSAWRPALRGPVPWPVLSARLQETGAGRRTRGEGASAGQ